ncbi:unnamed protein product [Phaeothamnion confervicola]
MMELKNARLFSLLFRLLQAPAPNAGPNRAPSRRMRLLSSIKSRDVTSNGGTWPPAGGRGPAASHVFSLLSATAAREQCSHISSDGTGSVGVDSSAPPPRRRRGKPWHADILRLRRIRSAFFMRPNLMEELTGHFEPITAVSFRHRQLPLRAAALASALGIASCLMGAAGFPGAFRVSVICWAITYAWFDAMAGATFLLAAKIAAAVAAAASTILTVALSALAAALAAFAPKLALVGMAVALVMARMRAQEEGVAEAVARTLIAVPEAPKTVEPAEARSAATSASSGCGDGSGDGREEGRIRFISERLGGRESPLAFKGLCPSFSPAVMASQAVLAPFFIVLECLFLAGYKPDLFAFLQSHRCRRDVPCLCGAAESRPSAAATAALAVPGFWVSPTARTALPLPPMPAMGLGSEATAGPRMTTPADPTAAAAAALVAETCVTATASGATASTAEGCGGVEPPLLILALKASAIDEATTGGASPAATIGGGRSRSVSPCASSGATANAGGGGVAPASSNDVFSGGAEAGGAGDSGGLAGGKGDAADVHTASVSRAPERILPLSSPPLAAATQTSEASAVGTGDGGGAEAFALHETE